MMKVEVRTYNRVKYSQGYCKIIKRKEYEIQNFAVIEDEWLGRLAYNFDPYDEYLVLELADGNEEIFANSYVDMFRIG